MKFKDVINTVDIAESVKMTNWIFLFLFTYPSLILGLISFLYSLAPNINIWPGYFTGIKIIAVITPLQIITASFIKKHNRIPNLIEYKKLVWGIFCCIFITQIAIAVYALFGTTDFLVITMECVDVLLSTLLVGFIHILTLKILIKSAAKKLQKATAKQPANTLDTSETT